jgi:hypothetical protein
MKNAIFVALLACACDPTPGLGVAPPADVSTDSESESATTTATGTTPDGTTAGPPATTTGDDGSSFIIDDTAATDEAWPCDTFTQDCPAGDKCVPWYSPYEAGFTSHCVPVHPQPRAVGEPCQPFGEYAESGDDCVLGSVCWDPDPVTNIGMCVELCSGTPEASVCNTPNTFCAYGKSIQVCLQQCEPRDLETCPVGCTCIPADNGADFMCVLNASGDDLGGYADPCMFANTCDPGLLCLDSAMSPDCDTAAGYGCCLPVCDTGAPDCPHPDLECTPWFEDGAAPPEFATLGACTLPH